MLQKTDVAPVIEKPPKLPSTGRLKTAWWSNSENEVLATLDVNRASGLSEEAVKQRRQVAGFNSLPEEEAESAWANLVEALKDPLAMVLTLAAVVSAMIGLVNGETEDLQQAFWIMGIVI